MRHENELTNFFFNYRPEKKSKTNNIYVSAEIFKIHKQFKSPYYNKLRFYIGDKIKTSWGTFDCALGYTQELNNAYPAHFLIIHVLYELSLWGWYYKVFFLFI